MYKWNYGQETHARDGVCGIRRALMEVSFSRKVLDSRAKSRKRVVGASFWTSRILPCLGDRSGVARKIQKYSRKDTLKGQYNVEERGKVHAWGRQDVRGAGRRKWLRAERLPVAPTSVNYVSKHTSAVMRCEPVRTDRPKFSASFSTRACWAASFLAFFPVLGTSELPMLRDDGTNLLKQGGMRM